MTSRVVLVTGCNGGVGTALCRAFAEAGYAVVGTDLSPDAEPSRDLRACDLTDLSAIRRLIADVWSDYGRCDVLLNNAGVYHGKTFFEITEADFDLNLKVNLKAVFFATQEFARRALEAGVPGAVVNIASIAGKVGSATTDYATSKAGVVNLTRSLGKALQDSGVRVNAIAPGMIETAMGDLVPDDQMQRFVAAIPMKRRARPQEIASVAVFLAGDGASYMTGATVDVNGGMA